MGILKWKKIFSGGFKNGKNILRLPWGFKNGKNIFRLPWGFFLGLLLAF
jgi:hypothetical protein